MRLHRIRSVASSTSLIAIFFFKLGGAETLRDLRVKHFFLRFIFLLSLVIPTLSHVSGGLAVIDGP